MSEEVSFKGYPNAQIAFLLLRFDPRADDSTFDLQSNLSNNTLVNYIFKYSFSVGLYSLK